MKIFLASSSYSISTFQDIIVPELERNTSIELLLLVKNKGWYNVNWGNSEKRVHLIKNDVFDKDLNCKLSSFNNERILSLTKNLLNDNNTALLADRLPLKMKKRFGFGMLNYSRFVLNLVHNVFCFLENNNPDVVYFRTTPHSIIEWVMAHVSDELRVPVLINELAPCPWRHSLYLGYKKNRRPIKVECSENIESELKLLNDYIKINNGDYKSALPNYEKKRLNCNKGKYYNLRKDIVKWYKRPDFLLNKYLCYKFYSKNSVEPDFDRKYAVFFLQYQPERTTLPEGFGFTQQLFAIYALRKALPDDVILYVKEHPSIFTNKCIPSQRHNSFYEDIKKLENVELIKINSDTFSLLDRALIISTITTGSVGRQALMRGVPIVYFGRTVFEESTGVHLYKSVKYLSKFVDSLIKKGEEVRSKIKIETKSIMIDSFSYSVSGISHSEGVENIYDKSCRDLAHYKILIFLLNKKDNKYCRNF